MTNLDGLAAEPHLPGHAAQGVLLLLLVPEPHEAVSLAEPGLVQHHLTVQGRSAAVCCLLSSCTLAHRTVPYLWVKYLYRAKSSTSGVRSPTQIDVSI